MFIIRKIVLVSTINAVVTPALQADVLPGVSALSETIVRESAIAFVNTTASPGLEGATLSVNDGAREQWRSSLGFAAEFTLKDYIFNGYWGLALVGGSLNDKFELTGDDGQLVQFDLTRDVVALRGSFGLSFPVNQYLKIRPYLSLSVSDLQTEILVDGLLTTGPIENTTTTAVFNTKAQMLSTIGSVEALYSRWYGDNRLELSAHYHLIHTDSFSEDNPVLQTKALNDVFQLKSTFSGPTGLTSIGRPWRWLAYANHTNFLSQDKFSLGYTSLFEFGVGMEWRMNIKPLDWFGWQMLGLRAGVITSKDVEGFNVGLTGR
ncbi:MAG: hypothetical protein WBO16_13460 [Gammaproteobacteria bacterium]|jgi:hypothetical protein